MQAAPAQIPAMASSPIVHHLQQGTDSAQRYYRDAMAYLGSAVNIVTTNSVDGPIGFTATAVCSVCDTPPTLLVCLNRSASVYEVFRDKSNLCVNTLAADQAYISQSFGGKIPQAERFAAAEWTTLTTGSPTLAGSAVAFDCTIEERHQVGTHDVLICIVQSVQLNPQPTGLMYFSRKYHQLV